MIYNYKGFSIIPTGYTREVSYLTGIGRCNRIATCYKIISPNHNDCISSPWDYPTSIREAKEFINSYIGE